MAHHVEPMDIDSDFDNKENSLHHNNVLPFTEKGYEELDVSELNMKLRYSITPASSPMSKSYTANCLDNRSLESGDDSLNVTVNENSLTRSLNSTITKNDKSLKTLPLQALPTEQFVDNNRSTSVLRPLDTTITQDNANVTVTVSAPSDIDENLSLPSSSSSAVHTPEATTPTKDSHKNDGGSPIMRGLKSVLNMFRASQSPIPPAESEDTVKPEMLSPADPPLSAEEAKTQAMLVSTPIATHRKKGASPTKRSSPHKESIVFNEDLEKELQWKDETTILFSQERIPIHKLFFQSQPLTDNKCTNQEGQISTQDIQDDMNSTVEYMDISYNDSIRDRTMTDVQVIGNKSGYGVESDGEFVDCETTFTKDDSLLDDKDKTPVIDNTHDFGLTIDVETTNTSGSRLKQIILNTTQDILDATLSITPEDLVPEALVKAQEATYQVTSETKQPDVPSELALEVTQSVQDSSLTFQEKLPVLNETVDIVSTLVSTQQEDLNVTKSIANDISAILDQTLEIVSSSSEAERKDVQNVTTTTESIPVEVFDNQFVYKDKLDITSSNETIVPDNKLIEYHEEAQSVNNNTNNLTITKQNIDEKTTDLNTTDVIEHDSANGTEISEARFSTPGITDEAIPIPVDVEPVLAKEVSMTELAAEVPLPDEDDLEKEPNITAEIVPEASTAPDCLPLDLVGDIKVESDVAENKDAILLGGGEIIVKESEKSSDEIVTSQVVPSTEIQNIQENHEVLNETKLLDPEIKIVKDVTENNTSSIEETLNINILPEIAPTLAIVDNETKNNAENVPEDVQVINNIEVATSVATLDTIHHVALKKIQTEEIVPMDINESVIELKPLPDIINQTITMPCSDNVELATNIPKSDVLEQEQQPAINTEKLETVENEFIHPEIISEAINIALPESLQDKNISDVVQLENEVTNAMGKELSVTPASEETNIDPVTTTACTTEGNVVTDTVIDAQCNKNEEITTDLSVNENKDQSIDVPDVPLSTENKKEDEEIILSENNSPFVSVIADDIPDIKPEEYIEVQNIDNQTINEGEYIPPASPPIASKGYNFNFDEIDDPFATKTKIRLSPPLDTPTKVDALSNSKSAEKPLPKKELNNRRKSQPERKKPVVNKRKFNSTFSGAVNKNNDKHVEIFAAGDINLDPPTNVALDPSSVTIEEDKLIHEAEVVHEKTLDVTREILKTNQTVEEKIEQPVKIPTVEAINSVDSDKTLSKEVNTSSSEQSTYYSAGTSSSESITTRNVFNLPEIDDMNFNPFATKSKMRQSPPPSLSTENPFATKSKIRISPESSIIMPQSDEKVKLKDTTKVVSPDDKMETELMEKDALGDLSNITTSSKATDERNATMREVNTEDEDTIEGPFLEAEDLNPDDKMSDFDGENIDMMQFNDLPAQASEENLDNGELFIDAEAFEFLLNQNKSNTVVDSGKESLFLKFDPLFAKRMSAVTSDGVVAALNKIHKMQSTPTKAAKPPQKEDMSPIAGPSNMNITQDVDMNTSEDFSNELNITVSKPTMAVPPAVNPVTPRNKSLTPNRSNRRSITFTSPAMAVIDRLLSLSGNSSHLHDTTVTHATREQNEADLALTQLRELLAEKEIHVYSLRSESKELQDRLSSLESHLKSLEEESQGRLKKINDLNERLTEKTKINKSMAAVVEEYERTIASLISETAQDKKRHAEERIKLINERDEQTAHLASMEVSFSDLHSKYEKSKQVILNCKANEDAYKKTIKEFEENLTKMQNNYELLKQHATSKLNHANQELEKMNRSHEAEVLKLNAMIKRKELHITSLEESLAQKTKANEELTAICDELINKVG